MRVRECYVSSSIQFFEKAFKEKYGLADYKGGEFVLFGLYSDADYKMITDKPTIVVWGGSDSMKITPARAALLRKRNLKHIAQSSFIARDLKKWSVNYTQLPVTPAKIDLPLHPRGDSLYCYYGSEPARNFYGYELARQVEKRTGIKCYFATSKTFTREQLIDVYKDCFLGLRLTPRDGVAVTAVELGMMGRKVIFNGDSPNAIKWVGIVDIVNNVNREFQLRKLDNSQIRNSVIKYLNIGESWLEL
jgi:hypothetical protein